MRIVVLRTFSDSCEPLYEWLSENHVVEDIVYDAPIGDMPDCPHELLSHVMEDISPDWVLMIGQCESSGGAAIPDDILKNIKGHWKFVHLCCDGSEPAWWPQIERYKNLFHLQVNIDGVAAGPFADYGITTLCPIDRAKFRVTPWAERPIALGFRGGFGHRGADARASAIHDLIDAGLVHAELRTGAGNFAEYREFLSRCRCVWNHAGNGGGGTSLHVKARVVEAAHAKCVLFENMGSPARMYFSEGVDYVPYADVADVKNGLAWVAGNPEGARAMAASLSTKAEKYSAERFWERVVGRLLGAAP